MLQNFSKDNRVFFEFHPNSCFVKYQDTKKTLLKGYIKDGLYAFPDLKVVYSSNNCCNATTALNKTQPISSVNCNSISIPNCNMSCNVVAVDSFEL